MLLNRLYLRLSITKKIASAFFVVVALGGGLGFAAVDRLMALNRTVDTIIDKAMVATSELGEMREALLRYRLAVARYLLGKTPDPAFDATTEKALAAFREHEKNYVATVEGSREQTTYDAIHRAMQDYIDHVAPAFAFYHAGKLNEASDRYLSDGGVTRGEVVDADLAGAKQASDEEAQQLKARAAAEYRGGLTVILSLFGAAIVLAAGVGYGLVRSIARPLVRASLVLNQLARRDYDFVLRQAGRGDEIGALSHAMETLRRALQEADRLAAEQEADRATKARRQAAIEQHTQDFGNSIAGVMTALAESAETMRRAAEAMTEAAGAAHSEALNTSSGAAKSSQDLTGVATAVEQLNSSVGEISRQLAGAAEVARQAVRRAESSHATMQSLSEATARIGDVVHLISNIAGQTNLLALNATIEAARAGEAGKGFAVVAGEVKTLAAQTGKATSEIAAQIETVRTATGDAVSAMAEIAGIIGKIDGVSAAISAAVEQQSATTRQIAGSVQAVAGATAGTAQAMEHVVSVSDSAGSMGREVLAGAARIGDEATKLRTEVDQFLAAVREDRGHKRRTAALRTPARSGRHRRRAGRGASRRTVRAQEHLAGRRGHDERLDLAARHSAGGDAAGRR
jgi:methyl-accepting chemotaxis protein